MDLRRLIFQTMEKYMLKINYNFIVYQLEILKLKGLKFFLQKKALPVIYKISELPLYILAIPFVIGMRAIFPWTIIRFGYIRNDVIGHNVFNPEYYLSEYDFNNLTSLDFFYFDDINNHPNSYWPIMLKKYLKINRVFKYIDQVNRFIPGGQRHVVLQSASSRDLHGYLENTRQHINFMSSEDLKGFKFLKALGLKQSEKFICLIVRDSKYKNTCQSDLNSSWSYHNFRDCDIDTYNKTALELAQKGYWVIRMGKSVHKKFKAKHDRIVDYAKNVDRSDFLDIWLFANCHFAISTGTGIDSVADIFRRPVVYANYDSMVHLVLWSNSISVPKKLFCEKQGRYLNLTESLRHSYMRASMYSENLIKVVDLDEIEIRDVVMEMENRLSHSWLDSQKDMELQERFMSIYRKWDEYLNYHGWINPKARIGSSYLKDRPESFFN